MGHDHGDPSANELPPVLAFMFGNGVHRDGHGKPYLLGIFNQFFTEYPGCSETPGCISRSRAGGVR